MSDWKKCPYCGEPDVRHTSDYEYCATKCYPKVIQSDLRAMRERDEWKLKCEEANIYGLQQVAAERDRAERKYEELSAQYAAAHVNYEQAARDRDIAMSMGRDLARERDEAVAALEYQHDALKHAVDSENKMREAWQRVCFPERHDNGCPVNGGSGGGACTCSYIEAHQLLDGKTD